MSKNVQVHTPRGGKGQDRKVRGDSSRTRASSIKVVKVKGSAPRVTRTSKRIIKETSVKRRTAMKVLADL